MSAGKSADDDITIERIGDATLREPPLPHGEPPGPDASELPTIDGSAYLRGSEIARGGMGRIIEARDLRLRRVVALKELLEHDVDAAARLEREALISAQLQHPSIVAVYEAGRWPTGEPFYAMKRVNGRSLDTVIAEARTLQARLALIPSVLAVFDALAYAHSQRIIHRDLKPANVLVGAFGETVVIDWGLAKRLDEPGARESQQAVTLPIGAASLETVAGAVMGTPSYMPPEQALGNAVDERADVYALGALLFHVLSGAAPFAGTDGLAVIADVIAGPAPAIRALVPDVPEDLATIIDKAMARDSHKRYASAKDLADDLRRFQTGQLVASHVYSVRDLLRRWARRHRRPLLVAAGALAIGAVVAIILVRQVVVAKRLAEDGRTRAVAAEANARDNLATALVAKARDAETAVRWDQAAVLYARARALDERDHGDAAWHAGLADSRVIATLDRARAPARLRAMAATANGATVVVALVDGEVLERDLGDTAWRQLVKTDSIPTAVAVTPDTRFAIVGDEAGELVTIERAFARVVSRVSTGSGVTSIAVDATGTVMATGHVDGSVQTWRIGSDRPSTVLHGHEQQVYVVRYARSGLLASGGDDRIVRLWRGAVGTPMATTESNGIRAIAFSPDGSALAAGGWDRRIRIWNTEDGRLARQWQTGTVVDAIAYAPNGTWLASGGASSDITVWDAESGAKLALVGGHARDIAALEISSDGRRMVSADLEGEIRWWDTTPANSAALTMGHRDSVTTLAWRGTRLVSFSNDATLRSWSMPDGRPLARITVPTGTSYRFGISPDGLAITAPDQNRFVRTWASTDGRLMSNLDIGEPARSLSESPDGAWYAAGTESGRVILIRASDGAIVQRIAAHRHIVYNLDWVTRDGALTLVTVGLDGWLRWWSVPDARLLWEVRVETDNLVAHVSPDGRFVAVAGNAATIELIDLAHRRTSLVLRGHVARIWDVAFTHDGATLASASDDGSVRLWAVATGALIGELRGDPSWGTIASVAFSPNDARLAGGYANGTIAVWDVAKRERIAELGPSRSLALASCDHVQAADSSDAIARACATPAEAYLAYIESRTGFAGHGIELEPRVR